MRRFVRYNFMPIALSCQTSSGWIDILANNWNEYGFNFFIDSDEAKHLCEISFRKDDCKFTATKVWVLDSLSFSELSFQELAYNQIISNSLSLQSEIVHSNYIFGATKRDFIIKNLAYTQEDIDNLTQAVMSDIFNKQTNSLYRIGVFTDSSCWANVVVSMLAFALTNNKPTNQQTNKHTSCTHKQTKQKLLSHHAFNKQTKGVSYAQR